MTDFRDAFVLLILSNAAMIAGAIFHTFSTTVATPVMVAFIATTVTFYALSGVTFCLALASVWIGFRKDDEA